MELTDKQRKTMAFEMGLNMKPEDIPTLDELPDADISNLVQMAQYQSTIDRNPDFD